ncbi:MAG: lamin tail domain-containing protein, partial [Saprospiraceae bacterium]
QEWSTLLLRKLLQVESFKIKFINRMADQLNIIYDEDRMNSRITEYENLYAPEIQAHADRWWNNNNWTDDVDKLYIFADGRTEFMWTHFEEFFDVIEGVADIKVNAQPVDGGTVHMNTMNFSEDNFPWFGQYFEGVDVPLKAEPKPGYLFTGWTPATIDNNALTSINLEGNLEVTANFELGSTEIGNVVINEINYHSPDDTDAGDWVELYNADETAIDVSGWYLDNGDDYFNLPANTIIPAYGYLVLVEDSVKFQSVHPTITNFIGNFGKNSLTGNFKLSNSGEWFAIKNADSSFRDTVRYDDKLPWPESPDGDGPTLQLLNASFDNALPQSWTASLISYGTPGTAAQGSLELGEDLFYCEAETVSLDAGFSPCFNCSYEWSNGETSPQILASTAIGNNTFTVTVTDSEGNSQIDEIDITIADPIEISAELFSPSCHDLNDGSILLEINGNGTYQYSWDNTESTPEITNLPGGDFSVTIEDEFGCQEMEDFTLTAPPLLEAIENNTDPTAGENGEIAITPIGGTPPYTIAWANNEDDFILENLTGGTYNYIITDSNGCTLEGTVELGFPNKINELTALSIAVFPNPSDGHFTILGDLDDLDDLQIDVIDVIGREMNSLIAKNTSNDNWSVDLSNLPKGVYFLRFHLEGQEEVLVERIGVF